MTRSEGWQDAAGLRHREAATELQREDERDEQREHAGPACPEQEAVRRHGICEAERDPLAHLSGVARGLEEGPRDDRHPTHQDQVADCPGHRDARRQYGDRGEGCEVEHAQGEGEPAGPRVVSAEHDPGESEQAEQRQRGPRLPGRDEQEPCAVVRSDRDAGPQHREREGHAGEDQAEPDLGLTAGAPREAEEPDSEQSDERADEDGDEMRHRAFQRGLVPFRPSVRAS